MRGVDPSGLSAAAGVSGLAAGLSLSQLPLSPVAAAGDPAASLIGEAAGVATLEGFAAAHADRAVAPAANTPNPAGPVGVLLHFGRIFGNVLRSASLAELAAAALPGLAGLALFTGAGVGLGRRQAKAGLALQAPGIARFVRSGPLGIARSGSLVVLRRSASGGAQSLLQEAA